MVKLLRNTKTHLFRVMSIKEGIVTYSEYSDYHIANELCKKLKRNEKKREENQILQDLCGTSARQARIDMGL
mgnify:CR=1 FL=1